ncbi:MULTISPECIES: hypothetical protein [unclassified Novosphingobium]|uniref:hypothetical protein n=1 Tax=unclassified Novosphingobium TaxID=2644732 RepID=UPI001357292F|nr:MULTISPECIES: hypothetical protein [unclassified Novosphingobium]
MSAAENSGVELLIQWLQANPEPHDDRVKRLLLGAASVRDASDWKHDDAENVIAFLLADLSRPAPAQAAGWQDIASAPEVKGKYFFCRLAWGPEWDRCTGDGFRWNGRWFVAGLFHKPGTRIDECQNEYRQIEVVPTHFMEKPEAPPSNGGQG